MARPASNRSPIRQVREALSIIEGQPVTQTEFAKRLGVAAGYINNIESGAKKMTQELALRISDLYGVDPNTLLKGAKAKAGIELIPPWTREPKDSDKKAFAIKELAAGIKFHMAFAGFERANQQALETFEGHELRRVRALLVAAAGQKKAPFVLTRLNLAITDWINEFDLGASYAKAWKAGRIGSPNDPDEAYEDFAAEIYLGNPEVGPALQQLLKESLRTSIASALGIDRSHVDEQMISKMRKAYQAGVFDELKQAQSSPPEFLKKVKRAIEGDPPE